MQKLKVLDLFSGIGGFSLGLERTGGFETVAFCEIDKFCQKVLKKHWPDVPIYKDVRTLDYDGPVDLISGGYPCQPFSLAGQRKGEEDDRHLWPAMFSLIKKHRPNWVLGENVVGHISMGLDRVLADLESEGYSTRVFNIPAVSVDAKHRRDRLWIVANNDSECRRTPRTDKTQETSTTKIVTTSEQPTPMADTRSVDSIRGGNMCHENNEEKNARKDKTKRGKDGKFSEVGSECLVSNANSKRGCSGNAGRQDAEDVRKSSSSEGYNGRRVESWKPEPDVGRVAHGVPNRVDRLKSLGNSVVPQIVEAIGNAILESEFHYA